MGERRAFERDHHNIQGGDSPPWLEEAPPLQMPQMDMSDANLFGMERFLEGEGPSEQAEQAPTLHLRGAESRGLPLRMTGGRGSRESQEGNRSLPALPAGPSRTEGNPSSTESRPPGLDSGTADPALGSSVETQGLAGGSRSDSRGSVQTGRRSEGGQQQRPPGAKRRGKRKLPVPDLDAIEDPLERRKQRRLLKNRNTAAASRERKQRDLDALTGRLQTLERDNAALRTLLGTRDGEIGALSAQVAALSERLCEGSAGRSGDGACGGGGAGQPGGQREQARAEPADSGTADPLLGLHPGRPLPADERAGTPGLVVGVDGQWLRLRPGYELPPPGPSSPQHPQQQQQRRAAEAHQWREQQQQHGEDEDNDDDDDDAELPDDGGRDLDPQWEPGKKGRKKGRRST